MTTSSQIRPIRRKVPRQHLVPSPEASPKVFAARSLRQRDFGDALKECGADYGRAAATLVYELTGHRPNFWVDKYSGTESWIDQTPEDFQRVLAMAREAAAAAILAIDWRTTGDGLNRHVNAAIREAVAKVKTQARELGLPTKPGNF